MKRKRPAHEERRRPLAEINLASTEKTRPRLARTGCFTVLMLPILFAVTLIAAWPALH